VVGSCLHVLVAVHAHTEIAPALHDLLAWWWVVYGGWCRVGGVWWCKVVVTLPVPPAVTTAHRIGGGEEEGAYLPSGTHLSMSPPLASTHEWKLP
jgi:hypothetical protein